MRSTPNQVALRSILPLSIAFLAALSLPAVAQDTSTVSPRITALLTDPALARTFDYCAWRFKDKGKADELPDFKLLLDREKTALEGNEEAATVLADAGTTIALKASKKKKCEAIFATGKAAEEKGFTKADRRIDRRGPRSPSEDPQIAAIQERVVKLWREDQAARQSYIHSRTDDDQGADFWQRRLAAARTIEADAASTAFLRETLSSYDWLDSHRFGEDVAAHAWILIQHADAHPDLQAEVLERMGKYLSNGGVRKRDYAYLWDRVAVNHDREQRYGTQPDWECKPGGLTLKPMEDPSNVDARRAEMGLGPAADDLAEMTRSVCG